MDESGADSMGSGQRCLGDSQVSHWMDETQAPDWAAIRHAYEHSDDTLKTICERFGVTKGQLEHRQKRQHWPSRRSTLKDRQTATFDKIFGVLEQQVGKLASATGATLGDKETQQLADIIKNFEKMAHLSGHDSKDEAPRPRRDMDDLRAKLATRLEQRSRR